MERSPLLKQAYNDLYVEKKKELYIAEILAQKQCVLLDDSVIATDDYDVYTELQCKFSTCDSKWWGNQSEFTLKKMMPKRYENQRNMLMEKFLPLYKDKSSYLFDMACADGEWTAMMSHSVDSIDGYEYSSAMVDYAKKKYQNGNYKNISFQQADIMTARIERIYDGGACLGLFTCLSGGKEDAVRKLYNMIKSGGYLVTKDTLNLSVSSPLYWFNYMNGYTAVYNDIETYAKLFLDAGFQLYHDEILDRVEKKALDTTWKFISWGAIWKK